MVWILVFKHTGERVHVGDKVIDFRGESATVTGWTEPHKPESSGRVSVTTDGKHTNQYFPSVYDLQFVRRRFAAD